MNKVWRAVLIFAVVSVTVLVGAGEHGDEEKNRLLAMHHRDIQAHLAGDIEWLADHSSEEFFSVDKGEILFPPVAEREAMFRRYLGSTTFTEYRDLRPPVVRVSDDGRLAWMAVQVKVVGKQRDVKGVERPLEFVSAWVMLYEKRNGEWIRAGVASTFKQ